MRLSVVDYAVVPVIQPAFDEAFTDVTALVGDLSRTGAYGAIGNHKGIVLVTFVICQPNPEKAEKYFRCAGEKIFRLGQHPDHLTSDESANEAEGQFGGAFRSNPNGGHIISVSGLPTARADTAVGLLAMRNLQMITPNFAEKISWAPGGPNEYWQKLMEQIVG